MSLIYLNIYKHTLINTVKQKKRKWLNTLSYNDSKPVSAQPN